MSGSSEDRSDRATVPPAGTILGTEENRAAGDGAVGVAFRVRGMDCPDCVRRVQQAVRALDGVREAVGNPVSRRLRVAYDPAAVDAERIRTEVGRLGYVAEAEEAAEGTAAPAETWATPAAMRSYVSAGLFALAALLRAAGVTPGLVDLPLHDLHLPDLLFLASAIVGGWNFFPAGVRSARTLSLDMNFLMSIAILGAVGVGEYLEAGAIAFLFSVAELLESYSVDRAQASIAALVDLSPDAAVVEREGREVTVRADEVEVGEVVVVRPGEKVPVDGAVVEGTSSVDESPITGESMPAVKGEGDEVFAGTINRAGYLRVKTTKAAGATTLDRIVHLVEEAEARRAPSERFVDVFARWYTPAVTAAAVAVVVVPTLAFGAPFVPWFVRGLTLLVIACPCALVISTPVAVVSGITAAARNGVLIKGGDHLEAMGRVEIVAFDKTGTLTRGHPAVTDVVSLDGRDEDEVLVLAAALERRSEHPVATAIVREAEARGLDGGKAVASDFEQIRGRGVRGRLDGVEWRVGVPGLLGDSADGPPELDRLRGEGKTAVLVGRPGAPVGVIGVADRPRDDAAAAIRRLKEAGVSRTVMLTGDGRATADAIAGELGIDEVHAELLPDEKVARVEELERRYGAVAMVGDGVNDGPALATARVGVAMGVAGSDVALETADVALMGDDLSRLAYLYRLSHRGRGVIRQNIAASVALKFALAAGVPLGMVSLIVAVLVGDMGASLGVTANSLRLARLNA